MRVFILNMPKLQQSYEAKLLIEQLQMRWINCCKKSIKIVTIMKLIFVFPLIKF